MRISLRDFQIPSSSTLVVDKIKRNFRGLHPLKFKERFTCQKTALEKEIIMASASIAIASTAVELSGCTVGGFQGPTRSIKEFFHEWFSDILRHPNFQQETNHPNFETSFLHFKQKI